MADQRFASAFPQATAILITLFGGTLVVDDAWLLPASPTSRLRIAAGFIALGAALVLSMGWRDRRARRIAVAVSIALAAAGLGATVAPEAVLGAGPGDGTAATALAFGLAGLSLALLDTPRLSLLAPALWPAIGVHVLSLVAMFGALWSPAAGPGWLMPMTVALAFWLASAAMVFVQPEQALARVLLSDSAGGIVARRLLLVVPVLVPVLAVLVQRGVDAAIVDGGMALPILTVLCVTIMVAFVLWQACTLHRLDLQRQRTLASLSRTNGTLERKVAHRTARLGAAQAEIKRLEGMVARLTATSSHRFARQRPPQRARGESIARLGNVPVPVVLHDGSSPSVYVGSSIPVRAGHPRGLSEPTLSEPS